jgi:hypothetical protein
LLGGFRLGENEEGKNVIAHNKKFHDAKISLDGCTFAGCTFERCTFVFSGLLPVDLEGNTIAGDCKWEFAGPAANTIGFMTAIYAQGGGAAQLIEHTFENIRKNATGQRRAGDTVVLN